MQKQRSSGAGPRVEAIRHQDTRLNIPTEELRGFVAEEETTYSTMLYPRDPSLDPQLVWKGKDEQDAADLAVPVVPIYIQEKIQPRALIADLKRSHGAGASNVAEQIDFFADFSGLEDDFAQSVEFYQHDQHWSNRMILGDSLLVMTSLAEKEGLKGKVQTIYFDPPYGINFKSNWQVSTRNREVKDTRAQDVTSQPEQVRAYRDTWQLGVHSYLAYMHDRLTVARDLLTETGSIFVQIGIDNVHLVRCLLDEVFGSQNAISIICFQTTSGFETDTIANVGDFLLWYCKDREQVKVRHLYEEQPVAPGKGNATWILLRDGTYRGVTAREKAGEDPLPEGAILYKPGDLQSQGPAREPQPFTLEGKTYLPGTNSHWKANYPAGMKRLEWSGRIHKARNSLQYRRLATDFPYQAHGNIWTDTITGSFTERKVYVVQTNTKVVERCLLMTTDPGDLVLDPTCGSGTTAFVAEKWGRRWITIDTSRVALVLARTRLMTARYPYYLLADSPAGIEQEVKLNGYLAPTGTTGGDIRKGFVCERVQHIMLESIANNFDIKEGMTRAEIDDAIARHAETETLYDKPYVDKKVVRVTGPFTVESLSPHRVLATGDENYDGTVSETEARQQQDFATMILDNLRKAGTQNLTFNWLEPYAGIWIHATGEYTESEGEVRRVAVSIGPEHGTVGPKQVKDAAKEAVQGLGHDLLLVCGFAFDPHVAEEAKRYGRLTVLPTRMNHDLAMGIDRLKNTGAGNLFMVFGEPDVEIARTDEGDLTVAIVGLDVYDPTTGAIRSSSGGDLDYDIVAWFIDTEYDGESFFVRHAYFTGGNEPYKELKRALRAEIDEEAWASFYSTTSRPFPQPETGKIAVKVINHYGDEVLKVFDV